MVDLTVFTVPFVTYWVSPELINAEPILGSSFIGLDDKVNVLVPVLNLKDGDGSERGFSKKNVPNKSPYVSATNLTSVTVAWAPLLCPSKVTPPLVGI